MQTTLTTTTETVAALVSTSASDTTFDLVLDDVFSAARVPLTREQVQAIVDAAADHGVLPAGTAVAPF